MGPVDERWDVGPGGYGHSIACIKHTTYGRVW